MSQIQMEAQQHPTTIQLQIQVTSFLPQTQTLIVLILATVLLFTIQITVHIRLTFLQLIHRLAPVLMDQTAQLDQFVLLQANVPQETAVKMLFNITMVMVQAAQLNMQVNLKK